MKKELATFAAGCFWGIEETFRKIEGVLNTTVGYTGGTIKKPTYEQVCSGKTGHAEAILIEFNPSIVSFKQLLNTFWSIHDPTQHNRQGPDIGSQYRSAIFYHSDLQKKEAELSKQELQKKLKKPIATEILKATEFYKAEEYHQKYIMKTGRKIC